MKDLTTLFTALSDPARLRILNLLFAAGELCVCDIERILGFTQTKVSRHMKYLRKTRIVHATKRGRWVIYSLRDPETPERALVLAGLRRIIEQTDPARKDRSLLDRDLKKGCCVGATLCDIPGRPKPAGRRSPGKTITNTTRKG
jgi:ArsR family transcriptional regulator